jgi:hypothetical protein
MLHTMNRPGGGKLTPSWASTAKVAVQQKLKQHARRLGRTLADPDLGMPARYVNNNCA